jgi:hypothetical protein
MNMKQPVKPQPAPANKATEQNKAPQQKPAVPGKAQVPGCK